MRIYIKIKSKIMEIIREARYVYYENQVRTHAKKVGENLRVHGEKCCDRKYCFGEIR